MAAGKNDTNMMTTVVDCLTMVNNLTDPMAAESNCSLVEPATYELQLIDRVPIVLYTYVLPVIIFVGLVGNILSIVLISTDKPMRNVSSSVYLLSVLTSDTGLLFSMLFVWLEVLGYPIVHYPVVCRFNVYLSYVCGFLCIWYVVCITVETYITICHPTKICVMCTLLRARVVTVALFIASLWLYVVSPIITEVQSYYNSALNRTIAACNTLDKYKKIATVVSYIDSFITLLVPFVIIIILLTFITLAIISSIQKKKSRSIKKSSKDSNGNSSKLPQVRVAKMLFILSVTVVMMNAPSHVIRLRHLFMSTLSLSKVEGVIQLVFLFLSYASYSVKFFICVACSKNFRKLVTRNICCMFSHYSSVPQTADTAA